MSISPARCGGPRPARCTTRARPASACGSSTGWWPIISSADHRTRATDLGFYHCVHAPARQVALRLAEKAHAAGQRLLLVADEPLLAELDEALWTADPASFLPHGRAGSPHDAEQPILLAAEPIAANGARLLMLVGAALPPEAAQFERVLLLFDDGSPAHARAREDWRLAGARGGVDRTYWQQTPRGGWEKKA